MTCGYPGPVLPPYSSSASPGTMRKYLRNFRGTLDRTKNSSWGKKASILYAFGMWTLVGLYFAKWRTTDHQVPALEAVKRELSEEEKAELKKQNLAEQKRRSEEISLHVAENVYTPVDFMA